MHKFTDKNSKEWDISLDVGIIEVISDSLSIDLFEPINDGDESEQVIAKLAPISSDNIKRFVNMIYIICEDQCKEAEITDTQFGRLLGGEGLKSAYDAFYLEWVSFFQSLDRPDLVEAIKKSMEVFPMAMQEIATAIKAITMEELKKLGNLKIG